MVESACEKDYKELLRFENRVFKTNFIKTMPKIYRDKKFCTDCHGVYRENGKIVGAIAVYPCEFIAGGQSIKAVGIGSVAVDKRCRGKGIMKKLMSFADGRAEELGADIGVLSGYRQRYNHYGYEKCGIRHVFTLSQYYISHKDAKKDLTFQPLLPESPLTRRCFELYSKEPFCWERSEENFYNTVRTWNAKPFAVCENEKVIGFIIARQNTVIDMHLASGYAAGDILICFARQKRFHTLKIYVTEAQKELISELSAFAEEHNICADACYKIFNFGSFIEKMLNFKLKTEKLPDGKLKIKIEDEALLISIEDGKAAVKVSRGGEYDLEFDRLQATRVLTTYGAAAQSTNALLSAWSPLCPIGISQTDEV